MRLFRAVRQSVIFFYYHMVLSSFLTFSLHIRFPSTFDARRPARTPQHPSPPSLWTMSSLHNHQSVASCQTVSATSETNPNPPSIQDPGSSRLLSLNSWCNHCGRPNHHIMQIQNPDDYTATPTNKERTRTETQSTQTQPHFTNDQQSKKLADLQEFADWAVRMNCYQQLLAEFWHKKYKQLVQRYQHFHQYPHSPPTTGQSLSKEASVKRTDLNATQRKRKHENATGSANGFNSANSIGETNDKKRKKGESSKNSKDPTAERKRKLISEKKWQEKLDQAISFHKKHGHWKIKPHQSKHSKADKDTISTQKLKHWIYSQKFLYKAGKIRPDRLEKLKAVGLPLGKKDGEASKGENATEGSKTFAVSSLISLSPFTFSIMHVSQ